METIATQVHNKIAKQIIGEFSLQNDDSVLISTEKQELYKQILAFGGRKIENAQEILDLEKQTKEVENLNLFKKKINKLNLDPRWKIITYGSLMTILKEHSLVMGPLTNYVKEIPEQNAKMMVEYSKTKRTAYLPYTNHPLFMMQCFEIWENVSTPVFYVCAGQDNFEKGYSRVGEEIFYNDDLKPVKFEFVSPNPDPIIVSPIIYEFNNQKFLLIDIVTSWDREAGLIVNEMCN